MSDWLMLLKAQLSERGLNFYFDCQCDNDGEISLSFWVGDGFQNIYEDKYIFNACAYSTNRKGATDAIYRMLGFVSNYRRLTNET